MKITCIVSDRGGEIAAIRDAICEASIEIEFQLKQEHPTKKLTY